VTRDVVLYTRRVCGLCDDAAAELRRLREELHFTLTEQDVDDDAELRARYNDVVPVVVVGGEVVAHAPIDPRELRAAVAAALG
jgi:glutaredoxin